MGTASRAPRAGRFRGGLVAAVAFFSATFVSGKELKYPTGVKPGDQMSGMSGEFFRYKSVLVKPPDDEDRVESLQMSEDVKCEACEVLIRNLAKRSESLSQDHIMDQFDGELEEQERPPENAQEERVNRNRKGCNKHFKDELLLRGYIVKKCGQMPDIPGEPRVNNRSWCFDSTGMPAQERDVDTYSQRNEAMFYACENTVGRHGQEMAEFLAERIEDGATLESSIGPVCREVADCDGTKQRKRRQSGIEKKKTEQAAKAKKKNAGKKQTVEEEETGEDEGSSVKREIAAQKAKEKKNRRSKPVEL